MINQEDVIMINIYAPNEELQNKAHTDRIEGRNQ